MTLPCDPWPDGLKNGYGEVRIGDRMYYVHRLVYTEFFGTIPNEVDHTCRNRPCSEPTHLEDVSHRVNVLRGTSPTAENAVKTHCKNGHPFDARNTYINRHGHRQCRRCRTLSQIAHDRRTGRKR